jgi:hypothetical protein
MRTFLVSIALAMIGLSCAHQPTATPAPQAPAVAKESSATNPAVESLFGAPAPAPVSPEQVRKAEALRLDGLKALYSKDPLVYNPKIALQKFQEAAAIGDPVSMDHLGGFYSSGTAGVEKSCAKAIQWFEKSAQSGYQIAMNNLAYTLVSCDDKKLRDPAKAEDLVHYLFEANGIFVAWLDTYAAILAAQKNYPKAADTMKVVVDLAEMIGGNPERIDEMKKALALYRKKKPLDEGYSEDSKNFSKKKNP